jgi:hypothetical protein
VLGSVWLRYLCGEGGWRGTYFSQSLGEYSTRRSITMSPAEVSKRTDILDDRRWGDCAQVAGELVIIRLVTV